MTSAQDRKDGKAGTGVKETADFARHAVRQIVTDLTGRKGLGHEWGQISGVIVREIKATWAACVERDMRKVEEQERARAAEIVRDVMAEVGCETPCPKHGEERPLADALYLIEHPETAEAIHE